MEKVIGTELLILEGMKVIMKGFLVLLLLPQQLDLDKMFKDAEWEEIKNVKDEGYEVEKVTMVAGVRGDEAEHEIFKYLYYLVDTKTGLNSLKLNKIH